MEVTCDALAEVSLSGVLNFPLARVCVFEETPVRIMRLQASSSSNAMMPHESDFGAK